jgi:hypothetical protein
MIFMVICKLLSISLFAHDKCIECCAASAPARTNHQHYRLAEAIKQIFIV